MGTKHGINGRKTTIQRAIDRLHQKQMFSSCQSGVCFLFSLSMSWWQSLKWVAEVCVDIFRLTDLLEGTDWPGIVLRLSSLIITKALMRLDSSSSAGSAGLPRLLNAVCGCEGRRNLPKASEFAAKAKWKPHSKAYSVGSQRTKRWNVVFGFVEVCISGAGLWFSWAQIWDSWFCFSFPLSEEQRQRWRSDAPWKGWSGA